VQQIRAVFDPIIHMPAAAIAVSEDGKGALIEPRFRGKGRWAAQDSTCERSLTRPAVRIRLPPAASPVRTCFLALLPIGYPRGRFGQSAVSHSLMLPMKIGRASPIPIYSDPKSGVRHSDQRPFGSR